MAGTKLKLIHQMTAVVPMRQALPASHCDGHVLDCSLTTALHCTWSNSMQVIMTMVTAANKSMSTGLAAKVAMHMATSTTEALLQLLLQLQAHVHCEEVLCAIC